MGKKVWRYKKVDKFRDLWVKGDDKFGDFIYIDKTPGAIQKYTSDKYSVTAKRNINPQTVSGKHRFYKTKSSAMAFVKKYISKY